MKFEILKTKISICSLVINCQQKIYFILYLSHLFSLKNMPYETDDQYSLTRTIRYTKKDNDNPFFIRYFGNTPQIKEKNQEKKQPIIIAKGKEDFIQINKVQKPSREYQPEKKNQKYRETQMKQIEELKKFAKVDIKKLRKEQRREQQMAKRLQEKEEAKRTIEVKQKPKRQVKPTQVTELATGKAERKLQNLGEDLFALNKVRSKSISMAERKQVKKPQYILPKFETKKNFRKIYDDYLDIEEIEESRRKGEKRFYRGVIQFNERIKWFARIKTVEVDGNLVTEGKHRNRCIHEDEVYFEVIDETPEKIFCKIVAIAKPEEKRQIVGKIDFLEEKRLYYITPINKRFIAMNVRMNEIQKSWLKEINEKYFLVQFHSWNSNSQYPECTVISEYGPFGQIQIESLALLKTHNVYENEYTEEQIQAGLKKFINQADVHGEYQILAQEISKRVDLRNQQIFTIDPLTARDFDDALSIKKVTEQDFDKLGFKMNELQTDEIYEIGVHIADASFFVQENSIIDQEAKKRTTSVYLVHKVLPMLPRVLCETMCSLNPGLERLTLSVWFYIDIKGNILPGVKFQRTVIKSKARFTYQQAQQIIEGKIKTQTDIPKGFGCMNPEDDRQIFHDIITMNKIALNLRKRRIEGGSLIFESPKKSFTLNENHSPIAYEIKIRCASNFLVEEYMLLANQKVGEILVQNLRSQALLRRHRFPGEKKIATFEAFMKKIGHPIKVEKDTRIQEQINKVLANETIKMATKEIIKHEMIYLLEQAEYFVVGDSQEKQWLHYALNMPVYTHFTSPIRRYPDIIVHRQLISVIQAKRNKTQAVLANGQILQALVVKCNKNKVSAKKVSSDCEKLFLCIYLKDKPVFTQGILVAIQEWGFKISVPKYDCRIILKFTDLKNMKVLKFQKTQDGKKYMHIQATDPDEQVSVKPVLKQLQQVDIKLGSTDTYPLDYKVNIVFPHPKKAGQKIIVK